MHCRVKGSRPDGAAVSIRHEGSRNASAEEVECIAGLVDGLVQAGVNWIDDKGRSRPLRLNDVLIVAPYNAQVSDLSKRIPNARVGTVDKFQGQQAPVVIYSLTTSSPRMRRAEWNFSTA